MLFALTSLIALASAAAGPTPLHAGAIVLENAHLAFIKSAPARPTTAAPQSQPLGDYKILTENQRIIHEACKGLKAACRWRGVEFLQKHRSPQQAGYSLERFRLSLILDVCTAHAKSTWLEIRNERVGCYERALTQMSGPFATDALDYARKRKDKLHLSLGLRAMDNLWTPDHWYERAIASHKLRMRFAQDAESNGTSRASAPLWKLKELPITQTLDYNEVQGSTSISTTSAR
jgi:hypothetical protein